MRFRWRAQEGSAAAELALLGPLFALLVAGLIEGAGLVQTVQVVRNAAREGARYASIYDSDPAGRALTYLQDTLGSRTDVTLPAKSGITVSPAPGSGAAGSSVTVTVPVTLTISAPVIQDILGTSVPISASATMRIISTQ